MHHDHKGGLAFPGNSRRNDTPWRHHHNRRHRLALSRHGSLSRNHIGFRKFLLRKPLGLPSARNAFADRRHVMLHARLVANIFLGEREKTRCRWCGWFVRLRIQRKRSQMELGGSIAHPSDEQLHGHSVSGRSFALEKGPHFDQGRTGMLSVASTARIIWTGPGRVNLHRLWLCSMISLFAGLMETATASISTDAPGWVFRDNKNLRSI